MDSESETLYFRLIGSDADNELHGTGITAGLDLKPISSRQEKHLFYDTFDSGAWQKGVVVVRKKGRLEAVRLEDGTLLASEQFKPNPSSFMPSRLPEGPLRELLLKCAGPRACIRICAVNIAISSWRILDDNQKTIALLDSETMWPGGQSAEEPFARYHSITPLRGYNRELARILRTLPRPVDTYRVIPFRERTIHMFENCGYLPGRYSPKLRMQLDPESTIHENVRKLLQFTSSVMADNEEGIRKDIDTEFLHDYRVAIRRNRSILRQISGVFEPHQAGWLLTELRNLGKKSNELRDIDVYLLKKDAYLQLLPPQLRQGLEMLFDELAVQRGPILRQFASFLAGPDYRGFMAALTAFADDAAIPDQELAPDSALPTRVAAGKSIRKAWKKVLAHGRRIGPDTDDAELHKLRIDCKKLRYLLEFFASLLPLHESTLLISHLKELQENLGDFVDLSVQIRFLTGRIGTIAQDAEGIALAAAIGGLVSLLFRKQQEVRRCFEEAFGRFDDDKTGSLFENVLTTLG